MGCGSTDYKAAGSPSLENPFDFACPSRKSSTNRLRSSWFECDDLPHPALSPRSGSDAPSVMGNIGGGTGRTIIRKTKSVIGEILSPGERTQVRAGVKTIHSRTRSLPFAPFFCHWPGLSKNFDILGGAGVFPNLEKSQKNLRNPPVRPPVPALENIPFPNE